MMDFGWLVIAFILMLALLVAVLSRRPKAKASRQVRRPTAAVPSLNQQQFQQQWQRIEHMIQQPGVEQSKSAIIEADKLLDVALRQHGFQGETMGERLKSARGFFGNNATYQGLWQAHKMRNALAHELSFDLPKSVASHHLQQFKAGLQYLKVL